MSTTPNRVEMSIVITEAELKKAQSYLEMDKPASAEPDNQLMVWEVAPPGWDMSAQVEIRDGEEGPYATACLYYDFSNTSGMFKNFSVGETTFSLSHGSCWEFMVGRDTIVVTIVCPETQSRIADVRKAMSDDLMAACIAYGEREESEHVFNDIDPPPDYNSQALDFRS